MEDFGVGEEDQMKSSQLMKQHTPSLRHPPPRRGGGGLLPKLVVHLPKQMAMRSSSFPRQRSDFFIFTFARGKSYRFCPWRR